MLSLAFGHFDTWSLYQKVSFDPMRRLIIVNEGVTEIDVRIDIYSDWKEWYQIDDYTGQVPPALRTIGGDPTGDGIRAGDIYFLINDWKFVFDPSTVRIIGVLLSDDYETAYWRDPVGNTDRDDLLPVYPATVSNLVTTIEVLPELQKSLDYDGKVTIDPAGIYSGTEYPTGTRARPVNNMADALLIAELYALNDIEILNGDLTINEDVSGYTIYSENKFQRIILGSAGIYEGAEFESSIIEGDAGCSKIYLKECTVNDLSNVEGIFRYCGFNGTIELCPGGELVTSQCYSEIPGSASPVVSYGGNNQVSFRAYSGGLQLTNMCANCTTTAEYIAGKLNFNDDENNGGYLTVRGTVFLNRTGTPNPNVTIDTSATVTDLTLQDLSNIDLTGANITIDAPTASEIRQEIDANSTQLAAILANTTAIDANLVLVQDSITNINANSTVTDQLILSELANISSDINNVENGLTVINNSISSIDSDLANVAAVTLNTETIVGNIDANLIVVDDKIDAVALDITEIKNDIANISFSGGLTPSQATMLLEMYELLGLDPTKPLVVTATARTAGNISQTIDTNNTRTIVTRD
jgi:hypothetical protein